MIRPAALIVEYPAIGFPDSDYLGGERRAPARPAATAAIGFPNSVYLGVHLAALGAAELNKVDVPAFGAERIDEGDDSAAGPIVEAELRNFL